MGRRVYLHIGTMKSATSYLGQLCELNTEYLSEKGLFWPAEGLRYSAVRDFFGRRVREVDFTGSWRVLLRQIAQFPGDVLLSNEMLAALTLRQIMRLTRAFSDYEVHVVVTARDPARVIPSHWQTTLKNGSTESWCDFAAAVCSDGDRTSASAPDDEESLGDDEDNGSGGGTYDWFWRRHDVSAILQRWTEVAPVERTTVVTVPPSGSEPTLVAARFGSVVGVDLSQLEQPEWSNPSLGAHSAELLRQLNLQMKGLTPAERSYGARGALAGSLALTRALHEPRFALTETQQDWTRARALTMIAQIRQSGVRVVGDLSDLIPAEHPPTGSIDPAETTVDELLQAASHGLEGMVKAYAEVRLENRDFYEQIEAMASRQDQLQDRVARQRRRLDALLSDKATSPAGENLIRRGVRGLVRRSPMARRLANQLGIDGR